MTGDADVAHDPLATCRDERLDRAAGGEDRVDLLHAREVVDLPQIQVIGLQRLERLVQQPTRAVTRAVVCLAGEKRLAPPALHDLPDVALRHAATVARRGVDVVDAEIERPLHDRDGYGLVVRLLDGRLPAEAEEPHRVAGLAQVARGHRRRRHRIGGQRAAGLS
jgi:hypothetical protein